MSSKYAKRFKAARDEMFDQFKADAISAGYPKGIGVFSGMGRIQYDLAKNVVVEAVDPAYLKNPCLDIADMTSTALEAPRVCIGIWDFQTSALTEPIVKSAAPGVEVEWNEGSILVSQEDAPKVFSALVEYAKSHAADFGVEAK